MESSLPGQNITPSNTSPPTATPVAMTSNQTPNDKKGGLNKWIIIGVIILSLIIVTGAFLYFQLNQSVKVSTNAPSSLNDLNSLNHDINSLDMGDIDSDFADVDQDLQNI